MSSFEFKKDIMTGYRKKEITNMAQENLYMFKRLKEKTSCYDFGKYDKEYDKAQYYKKSHCSLLPSIDFNRNKRNISLGTKNRIVHYSYFNNIHNNNSASFNNFHTSNTNKNNNIKNEKKLFNSNLFKKKLEDLKYDDFIDINNKENDSKTKEKEKITNKKEENKNVNNQEENKQNNIVKDNNIEININKKEEETKNEEGKKEDLNINKENEERKKEDLNINKENEESKNEEKNIKGEDKDDNKNQEENKEN